MDKVALTSDTAHTPIHRGQTVAFETGAKSATSGLCIEAYTEGTDRRAVARGWVDEIAPDTFVGVPFSLREICGPAITWYVSLDEAYRIAAGWARANCLT